MQMDDFPLAPRFIRAVVASGARISKVNSVAVCSLIVGLASCAFLSAQNVVLTGSLTGRVSDQRSGCPPEQRLSCGTSLSHKQSGMTNRAGLYQFPSLTPSTYSITTSVKGFHDVEALVRVLVGNTTLQNFRLQVGANSELLKVAGTTSPLRPAESSASTVIERSFIESFR